MSKKRLYKKNIKTKKKIKGGFDSIGALASAAASAYSTKKLGDELGGVSNKLGDELGGVSNKLGDELGGELGGVSNKLGDELGGVSNKLGGVSNKLGGVSNKLGDELGGLSNKLGDELGNVSNKLSNKVGDVDNAMNAASDNAIGALNAAGINSAVGASALGAIANNPFVKFGKGALNAVDKFKKGLQILKGSLTQEDKYRHALLKLINHSGFKNYFATAVNKVIVLNFYNVLIELGKYSRNYSDISKEIFEITGENMFDEDNDLYSELNEESSGLEESEETDCVQDPNINADKILSDKNIKNFLNDTMILCIPSIKENFKSLEKIIKDYKKLKGKMNGLLEKAERENTVEIYFDDFRILSDEAIKQINVIFNDFDTSKMSGGEEIDNIEDDFYDALLKMSIGNRDNFSKLLKEKLHGILNKIIKQLYDIANCKKIIDANNEYDMKILEKTVETADFNIEEFENRISERIGEIQEENLEIVKFQKILIGIIKKMICKIQRKPDIDLEPVKNIIKPAFIEKKMQFRNLVKIWSKDFNEKQDLLNEVLKKKELQESDVIETREYMKKIKMQIDIAVKNQKEIKEYIKTKEEKQELEQQDLNSEEKKNDEVNATKEAERQVVINGKKQDAGGRPTRKFSSPVSRKTRRRRQTSL